MEDIFSEFTNLIEKEHGRMQLALEHLRRDEFRQAFFECTALIHKDPLYAPALIMTGIIFIRESNFHSAIHSFEQVDLSDLVLAGKAYLLTAHCYRELGNDVAALTEILKAIDCDPGNAPAEHLCGEIFLVRREWSSAIEHFQRSLNVNPLNSIAHFKIAYAWSQLKDEQQAFEFSVSGLAFVSSYAAHMCLGNLHFAKRNIEAAAVEFNNAMAINPRLPDPAFRLGECSLLLGELAEAALYFRTALMIHPTMFDALSGMGYVELQTGHHEEAARYFSKALELQPYLRRAQLGINRAHLHLNQPEEACKALLSLCKNNGKPCDVAAEHVAQRRYPEALKYLRQVMNLPCEHAQQPGQSPSRAHPQQPQNDPRRAIRATLSIDLMCRDQNENIFAVSIVDVSSNGLQLESKDPLMLGSTVSLGLKFDRFQDHVHLNTKIVREVPCPNSPAQQGNGHQEQYGPAIHRYGAEFIDDLSQDASYWSNWLIGENLGPVS